MAGSNAGYDISPTTYSPDGRIYQIEYCMKAVDNSGTAIGVRCTDGVIVAVERVLISKMLIGESNRRTFAVNDNIGVALTGMLADGRQIINRAREESSNYSDTYGSDIPVSILNDRISYYVHYFTLHASLRPFGASALIAGYDADRRTHELYMVEPSGVSFRYFGVAAGKGRQAAKTEIEKLHLFDMTCRDALPLIAKIFHTLHDASKEKPFALEVAWVSAESNWRYQPVPQDIIDNAEEWAKRTIQEEDAQED